MIAFVTDWLFIAVVIAVVVSFWKLLDLTLEQLRFGLFGDAQPSAEDGGTLIREKELSD